jgi:hypothetical protein
MVAGADEAALLCAPECEGSEPVRAFSTKDEAVRFAGRQLGGHCGSAAVSWTHTAHTPVQKVLFSLLPALAGRRKGPFAVPFAPSSSAVICSPRLSAGALDRGTNGYARPL